VITGAALCPSPPLLYPGVTGREAVVPELRAACADAVGRLLQLTTDQADIARTRQLVPGAQITANYVNQNECAAVSMDLPRDRA
jgi:hypothetical protein